MATWYIFNEEGFCIATMIGAKPSKKDLESRKEFAVLDKSNLGEPRDLMYVDGKIRKIKRVASETKPTKEMLDAAQAHLDKMKKELEEAGE